MFGINLLFPAESVESLRSSDTEDWLWFNKEVKHRDRPNYKGIHPVCIIGIKVHIDEDCDVLVAIPEKYMVSNSEYYERYQRQAPHVSYFQHLMLDNCGLPFFSCSDSVAINNTYKQKQAKKIYAAVARNVKEYTENEVLSRIGADCAFIVRFPKPHDILCHENATISSLFQQHGVSCYGVDFDKDEQIGCRMIFCISNKGKSIDDYVEQISHYIRFDPDFRLE